MINTTDAGPTDAGWLKSLRTLTQEEVDARARGRRKDNARPHEVLDARRAGSHAPAAH